MASYSESSEQGARGVQTDSCGRATANMGVHVGAMCDDCGGDHGVYAVEQRGASYLLCDSCYEYACIVADADSEPVVENQHDDFEAEEEAEWSDDLPIAVVGGAAWWAEGAGEARDNGAYGLLMSAGNW
jgi:hypothetical protein